MKAKHMYYKKNGYLKQIIIIIICIVIFISAILFNLTRLRLMTKGYGFYEQNIILSLDDHFINDYLSLDYSIDFDKWDQTNNQKHYYDYDYYKNIKNDLKDEEIIKYIDDFYELYDNKLSQLDYSIDICRELMKKLSIDDFKFISEKNYTYSTIKQYIDIHGCIISDIPQYIASKKVLKMQYYQFHILLSILIIK